MADTSVFSRLQRLFATDVIIRNAGGNELKVMDVNSIQMTGEYQTNSLVDRYNRIYSSNSTSLYGAQLNINWKYLRTQIYSDYDAMDTDAIISSALDIIADESTLKNDMGEVLQIRSSDEDTQKILYNLFYDVLNIEFNLWSWIRQMCKYGDFFLKLEIAEKFGVYNVIPYTAYHIERQENYDPKKPAEIRFAFSPDGYAGGSGYYGIGGQGTQSSRKEDKNIYFDNYEMAHFRLITDVNYLPYGRSYLEPARKLYKQYILMEDAMLIHRIVRAPEKRIFYINVGSIPPNEVENFMQKTINTMKKTPFIDPQSGEYNMKYNQQNILEDFYIPVRGNDSATKIEPTKGMDYTAIEDVVYLRDKLFAALKVPKAFMGYEKDLTGKATLAAEDIRFARTIDRIQRIILSELNKIALVHLYLVGLEDELNNFSLSLTNPSAQSDLLRIEQWKEKILLYKDATSDQSQIGILPVSHTWAKKNILGMSDSEVMLDLQQQRIERAIGFELTNTQNVIKRSGVFDEVDSKYGVPESERQEGGESPEGGEVGGMDMGAAPPPSPPPTGGGEQPLSEDKKNRLFNILGESENLEDLFDINKAQQNIYEIENKLKDILNQ